MPKKMMIPHSRILAEHATPPFMKALYLVLSTSSFVLTSIGLAVDWQYIALAVGTSVCGSLVLAYIRPEKTFWRQVVKGLMATIVGLVFGSAIIENRGIETPEYVGLTYFLTSLLALIIIRALVALTEAKAGSVVVTIVQRILNVNLESADDDLERRKYKKHKKEGQ